jgi:uncharacterized protein
VIEEYAVRVFSAWQLGHKGKDDGLLMVVAARDRKVKIEVGDGLEGQITDALASRVIRNVIAPAFRAEDYSGGFDRAFDALITAAGGQPPNIPEVHDRRPPTTRISLTKLIGYLLLFAVISLVSSPFRRRRGFWGGGGFIGGGGDFFGGGRGGGGGGFFGGGGGGRSSGGGASGGW